MSSPAPTPTPVDIPSPATLPRSRRTLLIIISLLSVGICACVGIGAFTIGRGILGISTEQATITPILNEFMQAIVARDADRAYRLFSTRAQRQTPIADIEALTTGPNYVLFDGYQSLKIDSTNISTVANTDPDVPQGLVATVSGSITYTGNVQGSFRGTLEKENGTWRLHAINITVPPSKAVP